MFLLYETIKDLEAQSVKVPSALRSAFWRDALACCTINGQQNLNSYAARQAFCKHQATKAAWKREPADPSGLAPTAGNPVEYANTIILASSSINHTRYRYPPPGSLLGLLYLLAGDSLLLCSVYTVRQDKLRTY